MLAGLTWAMSGLAAWMVAAQKNRPGEGIYLGVLFGPLGLFGALVMSPMPDPSKQNSQCACDRCAGKAPWPGDTEPVTDFDKDFDKDIDAAIKGK
jgi:hypothetical protein